MRQTLQLGRPPSTPRARRSISSTTVLGFAGRNHRDEATSSHITYERVLRYPDGHVRRIRYPIEPQAVRQSFGDVVEEEGEMWETGNVTRVARGWQIQGTTATMRAPRTQPNQTDLPETDANIGIPSSPLELLRLLTSQKHKQEQQELWETVRGSYQILHGCPWPAPKPLYVLASPQPDTDAGLTYTLRTNIPMKGVEDELAALLGRNTNNTNKKKGFISCGHIVDGVIAFETDEDAEQYGLLLQETTNKQFSVARCDSHELFRDVQGVQSVVVLLRQGCTVPSPHHLAAALRGAGEQNDDFIK